MSSVVICAPRARRRPRRRTSPPRPTGRCRTGRAVARSANTASIRLPGHPLREVHPVRADVGDRAQRAALLRLEAPVPVGRIEQPVLQVAAVDVPDVAQRADAHERPRLVDHRVEAKVEVRAVDEPAPLGELEQLGRLRRGRRERLLANDVLAGRQGIAYLAVMEMVRGRHVDDVDPLVGEQRLVALVRRGEPLRLRSLGGRRTTPTTSTPSRLSASTCTAPTKPVPATAAFRSPMPRAMRLLFHSVRARRDDAG